MQIRVQPTQTGDHQLPSSVGRCLELFGTFPAEMGGDPGGSGGGGTVGLPPRQSQVPDFLPGLGAFNWDPVPTLQHTGLQAEIERPSLSRLLQGPRPDSARRGAPPES